jgi:hypothetical protein
MPGLHDLLLFKLDALASCPRLSRASTSFWRGFSKKDVDGRDKPGHDERNKQFNVKFRVRLKKY